MMRGMFSAISGLRAHQVMLDVTSNNIANVNTVGYKSQRTSFKEALSQLQKGASAPSDALGGTNPAQIGLGVQLSGIDSQMAGGAMQSTGNPLDVAIQGDGMFRLKTWDTAGGAFSAGTTFTRAGNFTVDEDGYLVTPDGYYVVGYDYDNATSSFVTPLTEIRIQVPTNAKSIAIGQDGLVTSISAAGVSNVEGGITLAKFANASGLERISANKYRESNNSGAESVGTPGDATGLGAVAPGQVEMSNVDLAQEFTSMITAQRGFQANSRVIGASDQMLEQLVNLGR
jgi:flagellar hook protein FlgE